MTFLEELEQLTNLEKKAKKMKRPTICAYCQKLFDNPRGGKNQNKTCSKECRELRYYKPK